MEYELKSPVQVMDKERGSYVDATKVVVKFTGRKGLKAIKGLQDIIFVSVRGMSDGKASAASKGDGADITPETMVSMLALTGKSEAILDGILKTLTLFATVGDQKISNSLLDELDIEDIDGLCKEVMLNFLLPNVIQQLNSLSK